MDHHQNPRPTPGPDHYCCYLQYKLNDSGEITKERTNVFSLNEVGFPRSLAVKPHTSGEVCPSMSAVAEDAE